MELEKVTTGDFTAAITTVIKALTPRLSIQGKKQRNLLVRATVTACKQVMHDKRVKKHE